MVEGTMTGILFNTKKWALTFTVNETIGSA